MKKLLAILLALMMVLVNVAALAADGDPVTNPDGENNNQDVGEKPAYKDLIDKPLNLPKLYEVKNGTAPAETFTFKFTGVSYKNGAGTISTAAADIPAIANQTVSFESISADSTKNITLGFAVADYELGVYTYEIEEIIPTTKTAGITYETEKMYLVLTILSEGTDTKHYVAALHKGSVDGQKTESVENSYDAGALTVSKKTTGNLADLDKAFAFTITFTAAEGAQITAAQKQAITVTTPENVTGSWADDGLVYTISLKDSQSVKFENLPEGTKYAVAEDSEEYTGADEYSDADKVISGGDNDTVEFTNTLDVEIDTGVALDSTVYMLIMALALAGFVVLKIRRREDY